LVDRAVPAYAEHRPLLPARQGAALIPRERRLAV